MIKKLNSIFTPYLNQAPIKFTSRDNFITLATGFSSIILLDKKNVIKGLIIRPTIPEEFTVIGFVL